MIPENLRGKLILYFFLLIFITNSLFALIGYSRESIHTRKEIFSIAQFIGRTIMPVALRYLQGGSDIELSNILSNRTGLGKELLVAIYDNNWWVKWGNKTSAHIGSFPNFKSMNKVESRPGVPGVTSREIFFLISDGDKRLGAIGVGIPLVSKLKDYNPAFDFTLLLVIDCILGISVAIIVAGFTIKPLETLMEGIEAIREGNYSMRVSVEGTGELAKLGETFNRMASTVQETIRENFDRNLMLDEKLQELWEIYELTRSMSFSLELNTILEAFLEKALTLSFSSYGQVILRHSITKRLIIIAESEQKAQISVDEFEKGLNKCFFEGILVEYEAAHHALLFIPLMSGNTVQGVLFLAKKGSISYSTSIKRFIETIAPVAASMVDNSRLYSKVADLNTYMEDMLNSVNSAVATLDRKNRFALVNKVFHEIFHKDTQEMDDLLFSKFCESLPDKDFARLIDTSVTNTSFDGIPNQLLFKTALTYQPPGKKELLLELRIIPLTSENRIIGKILFFEDITEAKKMERHMLESEKWAVLGKLAASVAHEIRNPLVAIRSLVEIIGDEAEGDNAKHVEVILGEVHRLNHVVTELLSLARPEATVLVDTDLNKIMDELIPLIKYEAQKNSISISANYECDECIISIDAEKIKQAFLNIILNAIQAIGNNGKIEVHICKNINGVYVTIRNNGPTISIEAQENIFTPFFTTKSNGTGLGLAITKKIVELHNGRIELTSSEEEGTIFKFIFPEKDNIHD